MAWLSIRARYVALTLLLSVELIAQDRAIAAQGDYVKVEDLASEVLRRLIADTRLQGAALNPDDPAQIFLSTTNGEGGTIRVDVTNLLGRIRDLPRDEADRAIGQFIETIAARPQPVAFDPTRVYANVRPKGYLLQDGQNLGDTLVFEELAGDLIVLYQVDEPQALRALNWSEVGDLNLDQLRKLAHDNLEAQLRTVTEQRIGDQASIFMIEDNPMLSPALLLSDWFRDYVAKRFPNGYLVGVPRREFVIVFGKQNPESLRLAREAMDGFAHDDRDVSSQLLFEQVDGKLAVAGEQAPQ